jgi:tetratricopeptide (TPR) repeat protein
VSPGTDAKQQARAFLAINRPTEALRVLYAALAANPEDAGALRLVAQAHLDADSTLQGGSQAVAAAEAALKIESTSAFGWRIASIAYTRALRHDDARAAARRAQSLEPFGWSGHAMVAHADASSKHVTKETRAAVAEAIRIAPNEPEVYYAAARVDAARGLGRAAAKHYEKVLALNPDHSGARNNLAIIQLRHGDAGRAAASFVGILANDPTSTLALRNLRATAMRALRIVYLVLVVPLFVLGPIASGDDASGPHELTILSVIIAAIAVGGGLGYVFWVRNKAGAYFNRFIRSVPRTDKLLTVWAAILLLNMAALVAAIFVPADIAVTIYAWAKGVLVVSFVVVLATTSLRRP